MLKKLCIMLMLLSMTVLRVWADSTFGGGDGSAKNPYIINTTAHWDQLATDVNGGNAYSDKFFQLDADISVTTMAGAGSTGKNAKPFSGTFDGGGHTLTFTHTATEAEGDIAPFRFIRNATICNLHVAGQITTAYKHAGGLAGRTYGTSLIRNCRVSTVIKSSVAGDATHGGIVAMKPDWSSAHLTIEGCVFDGKILTRAQTVEPSQTLTEIRKMGECTVCSFNYPSVSATGQSIVLSSALFAWTPADRQETDSIESLHIFSHITITADEECLTTTSGNSKEQNLLLFLPGRQYNYPFGGEQADYVGRCIIIAPDYEGYGVTKDVPHPYLSQRVTARQMIDGDKYGLALYQNMAKESETLLPMKSDWRSFCMGYSQGGAVSLATHREIEEQGLADELHFQGSICGDGPYDLVSTMRYYLEDDGTSYGVETSHRKGLATLPAVVPLILKGMVETHPDMAAYKIGDVLSQQLLDTGVLDWIDSKTYNLDNISMKWYDQLQAGVDTLAHIAAKCYVSP